MTDFPFNSLDVKIYDLTGRLLDSSTFNAQSNLTIDLPRESGEYLIQLSSDGISLGQKRAVKK